MSEEKVKHLQQAIDQLKYEIDQLNQKNKKLKAKKKYGLVWESEKDPEKIVMDCQTKLPILKETSNKIITNESDPVSILIEGDNYHALSVLNYTHKEKIDLIFIDPPYNTGNQDFKYNDRWVDREDAYKHSKWLSFMDKRLRLAKSLLTKRGLIFITIDDNEQAQLRLLCDEIFDDNNFVASIVWQARKSVSNDAIVSQNHNYVVFYASDTVSLQKNKREFRYTLDETKFTNPDNDPRGPWVADPFDAAQIRKNLQYTIKNPNTGKVYPPAKGRHWIVPEEEYLRLLKDNRIVFGKAGNSKPQRKRFFSEAKENGLTPTTWWDDIDTTTNGTQELEDILGEKNFNNPKPVALLKRIIQLATRKNSIVLDFFAGSGTTGHAVLALNKEDHGNRKFILCTNNEVDARTEEKLKEKGIEKGSVEYEKEGICKKVCSPRLENVIKGYRNQKGNEVKGLGGRLRHFKTAFIDVDHVTRVSDEQRIKLTYQTGEMIALKEDTFEEIEKNDWWQIFTSGKKYTAIYFKEDKTKIYDLVEKLSKHKEKVALYIFSWGKNEYKNEFVEYTNIKVLDIPEPIIEVYKGINSL